MDRSRVFLCLVLAAIAIMLAVGQTWAQTPVTKTSTKNWTKDPNLVRKHKDLLGSRGTAEQRKESADRFWELYSQYEGAGTGMGVAAVLGPGDVPHYFGPEGNFAFSPPLRKFVDGLPGMGPAGANNLGQYLPVAVPDTITYPGSDYYEISIREYTEQMHSDLPPTTLRGYVQTNNGTDNDPNSPTYGQNVIAPAGIHYLGPIIVAAKNRMVRVKFTNELPAGEGGDLFIPVDPSVMGSGPGPNMAMAMMAEQVLDALVEVTTMEPHTFPVGARVMLRGFSPEEYNGRFRIVSVPDETHFQVTLAADPGGPAMVAGEAMEEFPQNRALLHLHGGRNPWISDGTPHQWIIPAGEPTSYAAGATRQNVPDMPDPGPNSMTYCWSNQQSARFMFYHDHSWGITRLNVYAGEAAGYMITDTTEQDLIDRGIIPADQIPMVIQDKGFVDATTIDLTDPTWNSGTAAPARVTGDLWFPHVYMTIQNPYDLSGLNPFGRWHYGPWFWPPTLDVKYGPVPNPYHDPINAPWEPPEIPGCPNPSMTGESWFDTPVINGTAYPTVTVDPKAYRFRILNAANDRFWNLQWYVADPDVVAGDGRANTEVRMVPAIPTLGFPENWPTDGRAEGVPDPALMGPDWIVIGSEGGFLPTPAVVPNQPITWITDPGLFAVGNIDKHSVFLATAERTDAIVDFSAYAGQTLILYNDSPAPVPAWDTRNDYFTGDGDQTDTGGHWGTEAGFGPNTRTLMQVVVRDVPPALPFDLAALEAEFRSAPGYDGVFKRSQDPIIVGQTAYNEAYNATFPAYWPWWGLSRISDNYLSFQTVAGDYQTRYMEPKAVHDEMGATYDKDYGRMAAMLGLEIPFPNALQQNFVMQAYVDPSTEIIDDNMVPMSPVLGDGTQIWKITHNGVDVHPIHFHLFDIQLINSVAWDGQMFLTDPQELGWKETIKVNPLCDTIVALRPWSPKFPFGVPDSVRPLNPMMPLGSTEGFTQIDPYTGNAIDPPITNQIANFGHEYVWHCHILSHEEMDFMRPVIFNVARELPAAPDPVSATPFGSEVSLTWTDGTPVLDANDNPINWGNPANEIGYRVERADMDANGDPVLPYAVIGTTLANANAYSDATAIADLTYSYVVVAFNAAGDSPSQPVMVTAGGQGPNAPSGLAATASALSIDPPTVLLAWTDNSSNETGFTIQRATDSGFTQNLAVFSAPANATNAASYTDTTVAIHTTYYYRVSAVNMNGSSAFSNTASATTPGQLPLAPSGLTATASALSTDPPTVSLAWTDNASNETGQTIWRDTDPGFPAPTTFTVAANATSFTDTTVARHTTYYYQVQAHNADGASTWSNTANATTPGQLPLSPTNLAAAVSTAPPLTVGLTWTDNANNETGFTIQRAADPGFGTVTTFTVGADVTAYTDTTVAANSTYYYRVQATNADGGSAWSNTATAVTPSGTPAAPSNLRTTSVTASAVGLAWNDDSNNEAGFIIERGTGSGGNVTFTPIGQVGADVVTYTDATVSAGATYSYRVRAVNGVGYSGYSNTLVVTTTSAPPAAPSNLTVVRANRSSVRIRWVDNSSNETGFRIMRSTDGLSFSQAGTVGRNATAYTDNKIQRRTTYWYYVLAYNNGGDSAPSNTVQATTQ